MADEKRFTYSKVELQKAQKACAQSLIADLDKWIAETMDGGDRIPEEEQDFIDAYILVTDRLCHSMSIELPERFWLLTSKKKRI